MRKCAESECLQRHLILTGARLMLPPSGKRRKCIFFPWDEIAEAGCLWWLCLKTFLYYHFVTNIFDLANVD